MKKLNSIILLAAIIGLASFTAFAGTGYDFAYGFHFSPGYMDGFGGFGGGFGSFGGITAMNYGGFGADYGHHHHYTAFGGGFGGGFGSFGGITAMNYGGFDGFGGFGGFNVPVANHVSSRKIVPIPAVATATASVTIDDDGEIHVRPFDDEDLFVED